VIPPHDDVAIDVDEVLVAALLGGTSTHTHVCYGRGVGLIVDGVVEDFVAGKGGGDTHLAAYEEV
tara:strand:+ start:14276 stop:14470 length:195 start_codon:yes stop_codon:yes gene_type:complete